MPTPSWKSRAESMLSQFINGDDDGLGSEYNLFSPTYSPPPLSKLTFLYSQLENSSSPGSHTARTCCEYGVYDRLLGCGCIESADGDNIVGKGQCVSVFLSWVKLVLGTATKAYLSSPLFLALLPLLIGVCFGYWIGKCRSTESQHDNGKHGSGWGINSCLGKAYHMLQRMSLYLIVMLDPRRLLYIDTSSNTELFQDDRDENARIELRNNNSSRESGVDTQYLPRHVAVIMDGNRRYGKQKYGNATRGHWDGSKTLIEFSKWCIAEGIETLTVYAFSTENWDRDPAEVSALMSIFCKYCEELRVEAINRGIRIRVLATEEDRIPKDVQEGIGRMVSQTEHCTNFTMNICLSYGARGEIVNACKSIAMEVKSGQLDVNAIGEKELQQKMLTEHCRDPDVIIRTSGEERLSNFLLWQAAYSEFFFLKKQWPELQKEDLLEVIRTFAQGRKRRYGK
eukprot:g6801.t1 g6801   contig23:1241444-1242805(+)